MDLKLYSDTFTPDEFDNLIRMIRSKDDMDLAIGIVKNNKTQLSEFELIIIACSWDWDIIENLDIHQYYSLFFHFIKDARYENLEGYEWDQWDEYEYLKQKQLWKNIYIKYKQDV